MPRCFFPRPPARVACARAPVGDTVEMRGPTGRFNFRKLLPPLKNLALVCGGTGLTPMLRETSVSAQFLIPMATSLGFGVLFGSAISLVLVPCLYMVSEDVRQLVLGKSLMHATQPDAAQRESIGPGPGEGDS